jgi:hypothetical protein
MNNWIIRVGSLVLIVAGCLKLYAAFFDPLWSSKIIFPGPVLVAISVIELLMGIWLLATDRKTFSWVATGFTFCGFLITNLVLVLAGQNSCGCFGSLQFSIRFSLALNIFILVCLVWFRPHKNFATIRTKTVEETLGLWVERRGLILGCIITVGFAAWILGTDPGRDLWVPDTGTDVIVVGTPIQIPHGTVGDLIDIPVILKNYSRFDAEVIGGGTSCGCMTLESIPQTIPAKSSLELTIRLRYPHRDGAISQKFVYYLRHPNQYMVLGSVEENVLNDEPVTLLKEN